MCVVFCEAGNVLIVVLILIILVFKQLEKIFCNICTSAGEAEGGNVFGSVGLSAR